MILAVTTMPNQPHRWLAFS